MTGFMPVIFFPGITHWSKLFFLSNDQVLYFNSFSHCFLPLLICEWFWIRFHHQEIKSLHWTLRGATIWLFELNLVYNINYFMFVIKFKT